MVASERGRSGRHDQAVDDRPKSIEIRDVCAVEGKITSPPFNSLRSHNILVQEHLFDLEKELGKEGSTLYVLYPDESGKWRIQAVPLSSGSFESRKALPQEWRGLRDDTLSSATGVPGCIFIHASGFIGGSGFIRWRW
jgi:uncharacterized UPF0160 family protein